MRFSRVLFSALGLALLICLLSTSPVEAGSPQITAVQVPLQRIGSSSFASLPPASDVSGLPADEIDSALEGGDANGGNGDDHQSGVDRTLPGTHTGRGQVVSSAAKAKSNP